MKTLKIFWILFAVAIIFGVSIFISHQRLNALKTDKIEKVVVLDTPLPASGALQDGTPVTDSNSQPLTLATATPVAESPKAQSHNRGAPMTIPGCTVGDQFTKLKKDLGKIVNNRELRESKRQDFLKAVNDFRMQSGLPLPVAVSTAKLTLEGAVFNNCRSTCHGSVHEVFVSRVDGKRTLEVLQKDETLKKVALSESGVQLATIDELNKKGIPFRTWLAPVSDGDWYVKDSSLYYSLDIEGLWLQIDGSSNWQVVLDPGPLTKLKTVDQPMAIAGCNNDDECLEGGTRHFKAPRICQK